MNEFPGYEASHEEFMRLYCRSLPEDHRRRYAALEALKIGFGGIAYVSRVLGMSRCTIYTGIRELEEMRNDYPEHPGCPSGDAKRIRRPGGGDRRSPNATRGWRRRSATFLKPTAPAVRPTRRYVGRI